MYDRRKLAVKTKYKLLSYLIALSGCWRSLAPGLCSVHQFFFSSCHTITNSPATVSPALSSLVVQQNSCTSFANGERQEWKVEITWGPGPAFRVVHSLDFPSAYRRPACPTREFGKTPFGPARCICCRAAVGSSSSKQEAQEVTG